MYLYTHAYAHTALRGDHPHAGGRGDREGATREACGGLAAEYRVGYYIKLHHIICHSIVCYSMLYCIVLYYII